MPLRPGLGGAYISRIAVACKASTQSLTEPEREVDQKEAAYVANPHPIAYGAWQFALQQLSMLRIDAIHKSHLHLAQRIFEFRNQNGKMLAWLAKGQFAVTTISGVRDQMGTILRMPSEINDRFLLYYKQLYSTKVSYTTSDLHSYLDRIHLPRLDDLTCADLDQEINLEEVQKAMTQLKPGKTPRVDRLPVEFYIQYLDLLAPRLTSLFKQFLLLGELPDSISEAVVVVVLVPMLGRNPEDCSSYRPISLLKVDAKILAKVLANRLSAVLEDIIHGDQTGFIPSKGTDINLQHLFLNLSVTHTNSGSRVVASLDAEKAFDSVEWEFLWEVMDRFEFGPHFIHRLKMLYSSPRA